MKILLKGLILAIIIVSITITVTTIYPSIKNVKQIDVIEQNFTILNNQSYQYNKMVEKNPCVKELVKKLQDILYKSVQLIDMTVYCDIVNEGHLFYNEIYIYNGTPNRFCHKNCLEAWFDSQGEQKWCVGYAFVSGTVEDCWVAHSWLLNNNSIYETTGLARDYYFGYELTNQQAFTLSNLIGFMTVDKP